MKERGLRLSPKHGVNPSMGICFWCGESSGEILLLGLMKGKEMTDREAPREMVANYDPCESCKAKQAQGIWIAEAKGFDEDPKPTGRWWVMSEEGFERMFGGEAARQGLLKRRAWIDPETVKVLGLDNVEKETT